MNLKTLGMIIASTLLAVVAQAQTSVVAPQVAQQVEELDPFDPNIDKILEAYDQEYERQTGESPFLLPDFSELLWDSGCVRFSCPVYLQVVKSTQTAYLYLNGQLNATWKVSTGVSGRSTPNFDRHPNGRIYDKYSSKTYPGGNYNGLGNMPYAVFIEGGFAVHGTPKSNWKMLGKRASHGCIRVHPDNGYTFNRLVRQHGINNTWITVQN